MTFTEASTVENLVRDLLCGGVTHHTVVGDGPFYESEVAGD